MAAQQPQKDFGNAAGILPVDYDIVETRIGKHPDGTYQTILVHRDPPLSYRRPWQRTPGTE